MSRVTTVRDASRYDTCGDEGNRTQTPLQTMTADNRFTLANPQDRLYVPRTGPAFRVLPAEAKRLVEPATLRWPARPFATDLTRRQIRALRVQLR